MHNKFLNQFILNSKNNCLTFASC